MSEPQTGQAQVRAAASTAAQNAVTSEIESIVLNRLEAAGGNLAQLARFRAVFQEAVGVAGSVKDIIDMAMAGYQALTTQRRMLMRVSAAHGFGYWAFQHTGIHNPLNPPNSFLVMHRESDRRDQEIARETDNPTFSSDGGLTSADWNVIWRRGVQSSFGGMQTRMMNLALRGRLQPVLEDLFGPNAAVHSQGREAVVNQFRILTMCPKLGNPTAAAGNFFLSSLHGATHLERDMNLRLYRRFPYNPTASRA